MRSTCFSIVMFVLLASSLLAQDPPMPPAGFPIATTDNILITYTDGYQSTATISQPDPAHVGAPASGWPCVILVHGLGSNRSGPAVKGRQLAKRGYITVAYDVRGQGSCLNLNSWGGTVLIGELEKGDLAEILHMAKAHMGTALDFDRIGVMGTSQGGMHSWAAAAWSEQPLPAPRGSITHFPKIAAVAPGGATPNLDFATPGANAFNSRGLRKAVFGANTMTVEPLFSQAVLALFLNQDFAGMDAMLDGDPWRQETSLLTSSTVPVYAHNSWLDHWFNPNSMVDAVASLPATTPRHVHLSTGNHGSFDNDLEHDQTDEWSFRWFDQHMKGMPDEFGNRPGFTLTTSAMTLVEATDPTSVWKQTQVENYPNTGRTTPSTFFCRTGNSLLTNPPTGSEAADTINHVVAPGLDPAWYLTIDKDPQVLFAAIPKEEAVYRTSPFSVDREIMGRCNVELFVNSSAANMQINAVLLDEAANGQERFITGGLRAIRGRSPGTSAYNIELGGCNYILAAGHRLVLRIENHTHHLGDMIDEIRTVPFFETYSFDCEHSVGLASNLVVPFCDDVTMSARFDRMSQSITTGGDIGMVIDGGRERAGHSYYCLVSMTGTVPGTTVGSTSIPLNPDSLTLLGINHPYTLPFNNFVGTLDTNGRATATLSLPIGLPLSLLGKRIYGAALTVAPSGNLGVSSGSDVYLKN